MTIQQIVFLIISIAGFALAYRSFSRIYANIHLGKPQDLSGDEGRRWRNVLLVAFGQQKMFKKPIPAFLHFFIYVAFLITQVELLEIFLDGLTGHHRIIWHWVEGTPLAGLYTFSISFIEVLSVLALVATIAFLARRNILKISRFHKPEMKGWPFRDANIILFLEIVLVLCILTMNSADLALQGRGVYTPTQHFAISQHLAPLWDALGFPTDFVILKERAAWWGHFLVVMVFLNYLPISKHLHIILAFFNCYYAKQTPRGEMDNMPEIMNEVKSMLGLAPETPPSSELPEFGAKDIFDLSWKNLLDAYTCTECGRCTDACPANLTGKKLSPRKIVMNIRDRADEVSRNMASKDKKFVKADLREGATVITKDNYEDGRSLFDYISREELHACTTCNACVEACPVMISPLDPILAMRRYEILTESAGPSEWVPMFTSLENSGCVWQVPQERDKWAQDAEA
jgi:ferredoxin